MLKMSNFLPSQYKSFIENHYGKIFEESDFKEIPYNAIHEIICKSDDGSEGAHSFLNWRKRNPHYGSIICVQEKIEQWNLPIDYDINATTLKIRWIENSKKWDLWVFSIDEMIIGVSVMQFIIEKKLDIRLRTLLKNTLTRQLSKEILDYFTPDSKYQARRKKLLKELVQWIS